MNKNEFIKKLDELIDDVVSCNISVKNRHGKDVKILKHTPNNLNIELSDGKKLNIVVYGNNYCFFDAYKIDSKKIIDEYKLVLKEYEESEKALREAELKVRNISISSDNNSVKFNTHRKFAGFNEDGFISFILSEVSPSTNRKYALTSAEMYNREICKVLASGVTIEELSKDIDKYIHEYTDKNGSMKAFNDLHHANPSSAFVLFKKYINIKTQPF